MHDFCLLAGYGAEAINPIAFDTLSRPARRVGQRSQRSRHPQALHQGRLQGHPQGNVEDGDFDLPVYCGAQIFDAIGLSDAFVKEYFTTGTHTPVGSIPASGGRRGPIASTCSPSASAGAAARSTSAASSVPAAWRARVDPGDRRSPPARRRWATMGSSRPPPGGSTTRSLKDLRGLVGFQPRQRRYRSTRSSRFSEIVVVRDQRHVLRLDLVQAHSTWRSP